MTQPAFFVNSSDFIGLIFTMLTNNVTGSPFLSLFIIFLLLLFLCIGAGIPLEWTAVLMLPLSIYLMAFSSEFLQVTGFLLIYLGLIFAKTWIGSEH